MRPKVSIIIPTLNEEKSITNVINAVKHLADEIIVVDGYSKDKTVEIAQGLGAKIIMDDVGKGASLRKGFGASSAEIIIMMDADESHDADEAKQIINTIKQGYDVCMPSRFIEGGGSEDITRLRVFGNNFYKLLVKIFWGQSYTDICYGFRGFSKDAIRRLKLEADGFDIELEISIKTAKNRLKYKEIPSYEKARKHGKGKLTFWTSLLLDKRILKELLT